MNVSFQYKYLKNTICNFFEVSFTNLKTFSNGIFLLLIIFSNSKKIINLKLFVPDCNILIIKWKKIRQIFKLKKKTCLFCFYFIHSNNNNSLFRVERETVTIPVFFMVETYVKH